MVLQDQDKCFSAVKFSRNGPGRQRKSKDGRNEGGIAGILEKEIVASVVL